MKLEKIKKLVKVHLNKVTRYYGATYRVTDLSGGLQGACTSTGRVLLNKSLYKSPTLMMSILFHELGHHYCHANNKFPVYHKRPNTLTPSIIRKIKSTALRAELYVDKWGKNEFHRWYPKVKYSQSYTSKRDREWLKDFLDKQLQQYITLC